MEQEVWSSFTHDPRDSRFTGIRASDQDRELVVQVLAEAYADGRIDRDEFDERSDRAGRVRVLGEVHPILRDLVPPTPSATQSLALASRRELEVRAERVWRSRRREAFYGFVGPSAITTAIWVATSFHDGAFEPYFFWPAFVIVFTLLNFVRVTTHREEMVEEEVRQLEKKRAKELRSRPRPDGPPW